MMQFHKMCKSRMSVNSTTNYQTCPDVLLLKHGAVLEVSP